jgi:hypothetical protein
MFIDTVGRFTGVTLLTVGTHQTLRNSLATVSTLMIVVDKVTSLTTCTFFLCIAFFAFRDKILALIANSIFWEVILDALKTSIIG